MDGLTIKKHDASVGGNRGLRFGRLHKKGASNH